MEECHRLITVVIKLKMQMCLRIVSNSNNRRLLSQAAPLKEAKAVIR